MPVSLLAPMSLTMNGSASLSEKIAIRSARSSRVTVSSSAMPIRVAPIGPEVDPAAARVVEDARLRPRLDLHADGVEERLVHHGVAEPAERGRQEARDGVHALGDPRQPVGAVVDGVHAGHHREEHLRGADVAGRLVAPDVLLAGLERHPERRLAVGVLRDADDAARQEALVRLAGGEEGGVRAAVAHRDAEALGVADGDVGAELAGRRQQRQRQQVGGHGDQRPRLVRGRAEGAEVADGAVGGGILQQRADHARREREACRDRPPRRRCPAPRPGSGRRRWSAGGTAHPPCRPACPRAS